MVILKKGLYSIIVLALFLSGSFYTTDNLRFLQPIMLGSSVLFLFFLILVNSHRNFKFDVFQMLLFMMLLLTSLLSSLANSSVELAIGAILLFLIYLALSVFMPVLFMNDRSERIISLDVIIYLIVLSHLIILLVPIIINGISFSSYKGMFSNSNALGGVAGTIFIIALSKVTLIIDDYMQNMRRNKLEVISFSGLAIISLLFVIFSSSRTSFLSCMIILFISALLLIKRLFSRDLILMKYLKRLFVVLTFTILLIISAFIFTPLGEVINDSIIIKFILKADNPFDGREKIWYTAIEEGKLFGHGRDYFSSLGLGAHNTFVSFLGQYGWVPLLLLILFILRILKQSYLFAQDDKRYENRYLPLFSVLLFILLSIGEGMFFKTSMILMFSAIGFLNYGSPTRNSINNRANY